MLFSIFIVQVLSTAILNSIVSLPGRVINYLRPGEEKTNFKVVEKVKDEKQSDSHEEKYDSEIMKALDVFRDFIQNTDQEIIDKTKFEKFFDEYIAKAVKNFDDPETEISLDPDVDYADCDALKDVSEGNTLLVSFIRALLGSKRVIKMINTTDTLFCMKIKKFITMKKTDANYNRENALADVLIGLMTDCIDESPVRIDRILHELRSYGVGLERILGLEEFDGFSELKAVDETFNVLTVEPKNHSENNQMIIFVKDDQKKRYFDPNLRILLGNILQADRRDNEALFE